MFKYIFAVVVALFLLNITPGYSKKYTRCGLAKELFELKVPKEELARWDCIAKHESSYNTKTVGRLNKNRSRDYGIFQINNKYWCTPPNGGFTHNTCKINCQDLLVDSVEPSIKCSKKILRQQGWKAWSTWKFCNGTLPSIEDCFQ